MEDNRPGFISVIWNILMPLIVYYAVYMIFLFLLLYTFQFVGERADAGTAALFKEQEATWKGIVNGASMFVGALVLVPTLRVEVRAHREHAVLCERKTGGILITVVLAITAAIGLNILLTLTGIAPNSASYQDVVRSQYGVRFGVGVILYMVVSPIAEEIVFRGIIYNRMRRFFGKWSGGSATTAVIASGVLFGIYHGNLVQGIYGACMGILMAYLYERTHAFYIPCLFHAAANGAVYLMSQNTMLQEKLFTLPCCMILFFIALSLIMFIEKKID